MLAFRPICNKLSREILTTCRGDLHEVQPGHLTFRKKGVNKIFRDFIISGKVGVEGQWSVIVGRLELWHVSAG